MFPGSSNGGFMTEENECSQLFNEGKGTINHKKIPAELTEYFRGKPWNS
jgi:hypothetical protein